MINISNSTVSDGTLSPINQLQVIRQIVKPVVQLDDLVVQDLESGEINTGSDPNHGEFPIKHSKAFTTESPLIQINEQLYRDQDIERMVISSSDFLPTISITIKVHAKFVYSKSFPKDGDLLSVFIRSKDDSLKPIRNDYEITNVSTQSSGNELGIEIMRIGGILSIPGLPAQKCFSKKGNSIEVLQSVAEDFDLGFATNEIITKDSQTWLCTFKRPIDFIGDVTTSSWKDEKSFFTSFVDIFYHLNFVNIEPMFSAKPGIEKGLSVENFSTDYDVDSELIKSFQGILFTNHTAAQYSQFQIAKYQQVNRANDINRVHGYMKYMHYYDALLKQKQTVYTDPIVSEGASQSQYTFKGRNNDNKQRYVQVTHRWMGTMYGVNGENSHSKYLYAKTWNHQNIVHLDKLHLEMELIGVNMNLRRFQCIPVLITIQEDLQRKQANEPTDYTQSTSNHEIAAIDQDSVPFVVDKFYTGYYVIETIDYIFERGKLKQKLKLLRREWPAPSQT